eukprot:g18794.t1
MYMATGAVWSLYSSGRTTGLVLDSGHSATWAIPIYEGICVTYAIQKSELAGARNLLRSKVFNSDNFLRQRAKQVPQGQAKIKAKPRPQPPRPEKKPMPKPPQTRVPAPLKPGVVKASPPPGVNGRQQDATLQKDKRDGHWRARSSDWRNAKRSRTYSWQQQEQQGWQRTPRMTWNV